MLSQLLSHKTERDVNASKFSLLNTVPVKKKYIYIYIIYDIDALTASAGFYPICAKFSISMFLFDFKSPICVRLDPVNSGSIRQVQPPQVAQVHRQIETFFGFAASLILARVLICQIAAVAT